MFNDYAVPVPGSNNFASYNLGMRYGGRGNVGGANRMGSCGGVSQEFGQVGGPCYKPYDCLRQGSECVQGMCSVPHTLACSDGLRNVY
jgi:hypothetical protein